MIICRRSSHAETLNGPGQRVRPLVVAMLDEGRIHAGLTANGWRDDSDANQCYVALKKSGVNSK
jgi:hypothetical protein